MNEIYEYAIALPLGMSAIVGFVYLARHLTYLAFKGVSPANAGEDAEERLKGWLASIFLGTPILFGLCAGAVALGRFLLQIMFG